MSKSITAGIDFGNQTCILSVPTKYGVDIVLNQSSNRKTPTMVGYQDERRFSGEFALQQQMMNINNTITNLKQLVGLAYNSKEREEINKTVPYKIICLENNGLSGIQLEDGTILRPEQIIAYLLKSLLEIIQMKNPKIEQLVLTIPPWWNELQKRTLLNAASISKIKIASLINSTTAAAVSYVKIHSDRFSTEPGKKLNVIFIDLGDTSLNVAVSSLSEKSVEIKGFSYDKTISGQFFTNQLQDFLLKKVQEKYKIDPKMNKRSILRFKQATEKVKKALSANSVMMFEIPSLMNDTDISIPFKRDDFNELFQNHIEKVITTIKNALKKSNLSKEDIFAVELLGGGSRIPAVKSKIGEFFGFEPLMSLDLDECFAIGAGFLAAKADGYDIGIETIESVSHFGVDAEYEGQIDDQKVEKINVLKSGTKIGKSLTFSLPVLNKNTVYLTSCGERIGSIDIQTGVDEVVDVDVTLSFDSFGLITVTKTSIKKKEIKEKVKETENTEKEGQNKENREIDKEQINYDKEEENIEKENQTKQSDKIERKQKIEDKENGETEKDSEIQNKSNKCIEKENANKDKELENIDNRHIHHQQRIEDEEIYLNEKESIRSQKNESEINDNDSNKKIDNSQNEPQNSINSQEFKGSFTYSPFNSLSPAHITEFSQIEEELEIRDRNETEIDNTKNDLESLLFKALSETNSAEIRTDSERVEIESIKEKVSQTLDWFSEHEFDRLQISDYKLKISLILNQMNFLNHLKKCHEKIDNLIQIRLKLASLLEKAENDREKIQLKSEIQLNMSKIDEIVRSSKSDICEFDVSSIEKVVVDIETKLNALRKIQLIEKEEKNCEKENETKNEDVEKPSQKDETETVSKNVVDKNSQKNSGETEDEKNHACENHEQKNSEKEKEEESQKQKMHDSANEEEKTTMLNLSEKESEKSPSCDEIEKTTETSTINEQQKSHQTSNEEPQKASLDSISHPSNEEPQKASLDSISHPSNEESLTSHHASSKEPQKASPDSISDTSNEESLTSHHTSNEEPKSSPDSISHKNEESLTLLKNSQNSSRIRTRVKKAAKINNNNFLIKPNRPLSNNMKHRVRLPPLLSLEEEEADLLCECEMKDLDSIGSISPLNSPQPIEQKKEGGFAKGENVSNLPRLVKCSGENKQSESIETIKSFKRPTLPNQKRRAGQFLRFHTA